MANSKPGKNQVPHYKLELLEPRILFSADVSALLPDISPDDSVEEKFAPVALQIDQPDDFSGAITFINQNVPEADLLAEKLRFQGHTVIEVSDSVSGLDVITSTLKSFSDVSSIHIISHSDGQSVQVGDTWVTDELLEQNHAQLESWAESLTENADILIYGCNLAGTEAGGAVLDSLANYTGADIAASGTSKQSLVILKRRVS